MDGEHHKCVTQQMSDMVHSAPPGGQDLPLKEGARAFPSLIRWSSTHDPCSGALPFGCSAHCWQYLDENKQLILAILDNQNLGKLNECAQ